MRAGILPGSETPTGISAPAGTGLCGCSLLPEIAHQPTLHNPFPQLSKVAVAPFFNLSNEPTLDGRRVAVAYFNELQLVPGFEVVPVGVVEQAIMRHRIQFAPEDAAAEARRLAQLLGVDAVVVGAVTDYSPYYPPRCALQVEWYAANPCFHPIPPGYGLPWGTPEEEHIPGSAGLRGRVGAGQGAVGDADAEARVHDPQCRRPLRLTGRQPGRRSGRRSETGGPVPDDATCQDGPRTVDRGNELRAAGSQRQTAADR